MSYANQFQYDSAEPTIKVDSRPVCSHCGKHFTPASGESDEYCGIACWHLDSIGEVKAQILCWIDQGMDYEKIIQVMDKYLWFEGMTDSTVERFRRAIMNKMIEVGR
jgi:transposase-like protein